MNNTNKLIVIIGGSDYFTVIYGLNITDWVIIMQFYDIINGIVRLIANLLTNDLVASSHYIAHLLIIRNIEVWDNKRTVVK